MTSYEENDLTHIALIFRDKHGTDYYVIKNILNGRYTIFDGDANIDMGCPEYDNVSYKFKQMGLKLIGFASKGAA